MNFFMTLTDTSLFELTISYISLQYICVRVLPYPVFVEGGGTTLGADTRAPAGQTSLWILLAQVEVAFFTETAPLSSNIGLLTEKMKMNTCKGKFF